MPPPLLPPPAAGGAELPALKAVAITSDGFQQTDATHWTLDVGALAGAAWHACRDVCLFLAPGAVLPDGAGLAVHVQSGSSAWEFRGYISNAQPSEVLPTAWPRESDGSRGAGAVLGLTLEPLLELANREATAVASRAEFARRVAVDAFRFIASFPVTADQQSVVVPANALALWLAKFEHRFSQDPDYLLRLELGQR